MPRYLTDDQNSMIPYGVTGPVVFFVILQVLFSEDSNLYDPTSVDIYV